MKAPEQPAEAIRKGKPFAFRFIALAEDMDENSHISNVAYVRWLQDAARAHSDSIGWTRERYLAEGGFFGVRRHEIDYLRPASAGEEIQVVTWIQDPRPASATRVSEISRLKDGIVLARARTTWVWLSVHVGRPLKLPHAITESFCS
jgi:acyl-CoA thioester hydrolase